ncbi:MAG: hypothetical protein HYY46_18670 [Deltaproteobacteria bacterium]|nr:hypothetical protein [Deltaproteobacteria bacterium]
MSVFVDTSGLYARLVRTEERHSEMIMAHAEGLVPGFYILPLAGRARLIENVPDGEVGPERPAGSGVTQNRPMMVT